MLSSSLKYFWLQQNVFWWNRSLTSQTTRLLFASNLHHLLYFRVVGFVCWLCWPTQDVYLLPLIHGAIQLKEMIHTANNRKSMDGVAFWDGWSYCPSSNCSMSCPLSTAEGFFYTYCNSDRCEWKQEVHFQDGFTKAALDACSCGRLLRCKNYNYSNLRLVQTTLCCH